MLFCFGMRLKLFVGYIYFLDLTAPYRSFYTVVLPGLLWFEIWINDPFFFLSHAIFYVSSLPDNDPGSNIM